MGLIIADVADQVVPSSVPKEAFDQASVQALLARSLTKAPSPKPCVPCLEAQTQTPTSPVPPNPACCNPLLSGSSHDPLCWPPRENAVDLGLRGPELTPPEHRETASPRLGCVLPCSVMARDATWQGFFLNGTSVLQLQQRQHPPPPPHHHHCRYRGSCTAVDVGANSFSSRSALQTSAPAASGAAPWQAAPSSPR